MNTLIVFYSSGGPTEALALAAGVGAIQAHASIRLRRVPPVRGTDLDRLTPAERDTFARMSRDYTAPRAEDVAWADALILATSGSGVPPLQAFLEGLQPIAADAVKIAAPATADGEPGVLRSLYAASAAAGLIVVPMPAGPIASIEAGHAFGRRVVAVAKALKAG